MLMIELEDDCVVVVMNVVKHEAVSLIERTGSENARNIRARKTETLPPSSGRVRVGADRFDVRQRNVELRLQGPEPVPSFDFEMNTIPEHGDVNHTNKVLRRRWCSRIGRTKGKRIRQPHHFCHCDLSKATLIRPMQSGYEERISPLCEDLIEY